ncbi:MAG: prolipoprotein diacylglyceryl transferase family protein [Phycisphaerae bacterium]
MRQIILDFGALELFGRTIHLRVPGYGLMVAVGFLLAILLARRRARRCGENPDVLTNCGILALIGGIAGARIAYVIENWNAFSGNGAFGIFDFTAGGLIYYGGVILATLMVLIYLRARKLPLRRYLDILAVSLMVGLAFGRAGCTLNGCCYGGVARQDWALAVRFPMYTPPLVKLGGDDNPFWEGGGATPIYSDQFKKGQVRPDPRLLNSFSSSLLPPVDLHGKLQRDQLEVMQADIDEVRELFIRTAGEDLLLGRADWYAGRREGDGLLRGSEPWSEAVLFDTSGDGRLTFAEAWRYLQARRAELAERFDSDDDSRLGGAERSEANRWLQQDLYALAMAERSAPVKPAQPLALVNALLIAVLLTVFFRLRRWEGQVFALLVIAYPITRFVLESVRADNPHNLLRGVLTHNQYTSLAMLGGGVLLYLLWRRLPASAGPVLAERVKATTGGKNYRAKTGKR